VRIGVLLRVPESSRPTYITQFLRNFELLQKAAEKRWPEAVTTNSGIVLALAKIAARQTLGRKKT